MTILNGLLIWGRGVDVFKPIELRIFKYHHFPTPLHGGTTLDTTMIVLGTMTVMWTIFIIVGLMVTVPIIKNWILKGVNDMTEEEEKLELLERTEIPVTNQDVVLETEDETKVYLALLEYNRWMEESKLEELMVETGEANREEIDAGEHYPYIAKLISDGSIVCKNVTTHDGRKLNFYMLTQIGHELAEDMEEEE